MHKNAKAHALPSQQRLLTVKIWGTAAVTNWPVQCWECVGTSNCQVLSLLKGRLKISLVPFTVIFAGFADLTRLCLASTGQALLRATYHGTKKRMTCHKSSLKNFQHQPKTSARCLAHPSYLSAFPARTVHVRTCY